MNQKTGKRRQLEKCNQQNTIQRQSEIGFRFRFGAKNQSLHDCTEKKTNLKNDHKLRSKIAKQTKMMNIEKQTQATKQS